LEVRDSGSGVWTKHHVARGTRYGPFVGKLTPEPIDPRYAWEVSLCSTLRAGLGQSRRESKDSGKKCRGSKHPASFELVHLLQSTFVYFPLVVVL
jgi:hypothetical protein